MRKRKREISILSNKKRLTVGQQQQFHHHHQHNIIFNCGQDFIFYSIINMRRATLCSFGLLVILVLAMSPGSDAGRRRILMAKKLAALLLLNKKRYIFVAPFPLPVPLPVITKVKHIVHKEKIPVPVPVPHHVTKYVAVPVPVPAPKSWSDDSWKTPDHHAIASSEVSYKISEKPHHPKHLEKIYAESSHNLKFLEKPTYSEEPIKMSEKSYHENDYKLPMEKPYHHLEDGDKLPERLYSEEPVKFDHLEHYKGAASSLAEETIELPKKFRSHKTEESFKFPDNFSPDELLAKLQSELGAANSGVGSPEYLNNEPSELSAENYPMLPEGGMMIKKK
ncbi:uncharacterized protein LOC128393030 isoform X3 [Panonychus citri]|uniref:uncharacterized protein LOC128393030 isoform X3 n=1 Tax=Panonychus citri TaxID=50023 RepID=UPI002307AADC|nr:uncharacterized protein LOC128393030 isoform X3 [Panonychus citri]